MARPALMVVLAVLAAVNPEAPKWDADELKNIFARIQVAQTHLQGDAQNDEYAAIAGIAYRLPRQANESTELYIQRVLKARRPDHPKVKKDQWIAALYRQFYEDLAQRCDFVGRISRPGKDRVFFEQMAQLSKNSANALASQIEISIEGLEGFIAPLPVADGDEPVTFGASVTVRNGIISVEGIDRVRFKDDQPPQRTVRTARGAIKELFSAMKQHNVSAEMIGHYEGQWRKNKGNLRVIIPAASPSIYLNEIVRAGIEAEMTTLHLMAMSKKGALCELLLEISKPKPTGSKNKKATKKKGDDAESAAPETVFCADTLPMQKCADRLADARTKGQVRYKLE